MFRFITLLKPELGGLAVLAEQTLVKHPRVLHIGSIENLLTQEERLQTWSSGIQSLQIHGSRNSNKLGASKLEITRHQHQNCFLD